MKTDGLRKGAILSFVLSMLILLIGGYLSIDKVPPYPEKVLSQNGELITDYQRIINGQNIYQKYGLMDHGSIWGHGTLRGPDFSAQVIRLTIDHMREYLSEKEFAKSYKQLTDKERAIINSNVLNEIKTNRYNTETKELYLTDAQKYALFKIRDYYNDLFKNGDVEKRENGYGFLKNTIPDENDRINISDFFFLTGWIASVNRHGEDITYTNNWPYDKDVGNNLSKYAFLWSIG
jgi:nitric oxide reductase subunit B